MSTAATLALAGGANTGARRMPGAAAPGDDDAGPASFAARFAEARGSIDADDNRAASGPAAADAPSAPADMTQAPPLPPLAPGAQDIAAGALAVASTPAGATQTAREDLPSGGDIVSIRADASHAAGGSSAQPRVADTGEARGRSTLDVASQTRGLPGAAIENIPNPSGAARTTGGAVRATEGAARPAGDARGEPAMPALRGAAAPEPDAVATGAEEGAEAVATPGTSALLRGAAASGVQARAVRPATQGSDHGAAAMRTAKAGSDEAADGLEPAASRRRGDVDTDAGTMTTAADRQPQARAPEAASTLTVPAGGTQATADAAPADAFATSPSAPLHEGRLHAHPASPQFAPALGQQLQVYVREGIQHARLHLNPEDMGPISVRISIDGDAARVVLTADLPATRQALEQAMPVLAVSLREEGLTLAGGGVFEQPRDPGQQAGSGSQGARQRSGGDIEPVTAEAVQPAVRAPSRRSNGAVDVYA